MKISLLALLLGFWHVATVAQTAAQQPTTYALIVGLSQYKEVAPLQFADRDATAFAGFLKTQQVPDNHIKLFLNEEATRLNIVDELFTLTQALKPHDRFYFYFGGHGDLEAKIGAENALLLLYNSFKTGYFQGNEYLQLSELKTWFDALTRKQVEVIFIADACHSGSLIGGKEGLNKTQRALQQSWGGITRMLSCRADEFSLEGKQWGGGRGLFSYHLVNGLTGRADANRDNKVSLKELNTYLKVNVLKEANPNVQTPVIDGRDTQFLSTVSAEGLAELADEEKRNFPIITEVNLKGDGERANAELVSRLDTSLVNTYKQFTKALKEKRASVYDDSTDYALLYYKQLTAQKLPGSLVQIMKRNLAVALMERELDIMRALRERGEGYIGATDSKMISAISNLDEVMKLFGSEHYFYNYLKARKLVLESQSISKTPLTPEQRQKKTEKLFLSLKLEPNMISTYSLLSTYYRIKQKPDSSIYYQEKVVELLPNQAIAYINLAGNYSILNYVDATNKRVPHPKVVQYLEKAIALDSTQKNAYSMLGELYLSGKFYNGQDTLAFHNYPKSIYYYEKALTFQEISEEELRKIDFNSINPDALESHAHSLNASRAKFGLQNKYYTLLCFLNKATGNLTKSNEYLEKLNRKIDIVGSVSAYLGGVFNMYSLCYYDRSNSDMYLKYSLGFLQKALKKSDQELKIASASDKPLLALKYRELLKGMGATNRSIKNYSEAEAMLQQALAYPIPDSPVKIRLKLGEYDLVEFPDRLVSADFRVSKTRSGDYEYYIDTNVEMFLLKLDQNKPDEAMGWLEKALQNSVSEKGNGLSSKSFTELVLKTYNNIDKEVYMALFNKYYPPTAQTK